ncbi:MAG: lytic transglycosylase domain-containing protein [Rhodospirillales bacterium]|nr:lytic transglycosylase domain-containing protein [Rhodospirillales bacterium]
MGEAIAQPPTKSSIVPAARAALPTLRPPKPPAHRVLGAVFSAVELGQWDKAYGLASKSNDAILPKVISWIRFTSSGEKAGFEEIATFIEENPDWPSMRTLHANAVEAMNNTLPRTRIIEWLTRHPPVSTKGASMLADALRARGQKDRARALIRKTWINMNFSSALERRFYRRYRRQLTLSDHLKRLDRLLWVGRSWEARRMFRRVKGSQLYLGIARLRLRRYRGGVDWAIRRIPEHLQNDPGFLYERLRWRQRKGRDKEAIELLNNLPKSVPYAHLWWRERGALARRALRKGNITIAYDLAKDHRQKKGAELADAEWLAGWIALRFLKDPKLALGHFTRMFRKVAYPISLARGAYWIARTHEAMNKQTTANTWDAQAARHFTTFYGQLSLGKLANSANLSSSLSGALPDMPKTHLDQNYSNKSVVRAARLISASHERNHMKAFTRHLIKNAKTSGEHAVIATLALEHGRPDIALDSAKKSLRKGVYLIKAGWPRTKLPKNRNGLEEGILLALMRQESAFDPQAVSWAGARGLMQVMPATARKVAKRLGLPFSRKRLLADPEYNMKIGTAYFASVFSQFDGSYILALAAYNAGPGRPKRWLRRHGDFRKGEIDAVDWIEMIPFKQTRNYVQRVIENLQVYRAVYGKGTIIETAIRNPNL